MQAKDIDTIEVLQRIEAVKTSIGASVWRINGWERVTEDFPEAEHRWPEKVLRAKLSSLMRKGYLSGCDCGCRGDYELTPKGLERLREAFAAPTREK